MSESDNSDDESIGNIDDMLNDSRLYADSQDIEGITNGFDNETQSSRGNTSSGSNVRKYRQKTRYMRVRVSADKKAELEAKYKKLGEQIKHAQEIASNQRGVKRLGRIVAETNSLYTTGGARAASTLDANCITLISGQTKERVKKLETDSKCFNYDEFAERIMEKMIEGQDEEDAESQSGSDSDDEMPGPSSTSPRVKVKNRKIRIKLGALYDSCRNTAPKYTFDVALVDLRRDIKSQSQAPRAKRIKKEDPKSQQVKPAQVNANELNKDSTPKEVEHILKRVKKISMKNDNAPLPFYSMLVNPTSFSETVENIFHTSFLVKDGELKIKADDDGEPEMEPINEDSDEEGTHEGEQSVLSFTMEDWKRWQNKYNITKAAIKH